MKTKLTIIHSLDQIQMEGYQNHNMMFALELSWRFSLKSWRAFVQGPLFFLIYINEIHIGLSPGTKISLFANDSLLYRPITDGSDNLRLQKDLDTLQQWESKNKMEFHPDKCSLLQITDRLHPGNFIYNIHNTPIQVTKFAKYLCVTIDDSLSWDPHIKSTFQTAGLNATFKMSLPHQNPML